MNDSGKRRWEIDRTDIILLINLSVYKSFVN